MKTHFLIPLSFVLLFSCNTQKKIIHFTNDSARFSQYKSFAIANFKVGESDISQEGLTILSEIENQIKDKMELRAYRLDNNQPDLIVRYELMSNQRVESRTASPYAYGMYPNMYNPMYSPFSPFGNNYSYTRIILESALLLEITDLQTKKIIWQASVDLNQYSKQNKKEEILAEAISELFDTYLYRAQSNSPDESLISNK